MISKLHLHLLHYILAKCLITGTILNFKSKYWRFVPEEMESFYDREAGIAWGPITKQEMLDDILLRGKKKVKRRFTLSYNPSFSDDKEERFLQMHKNTDPPNDDGILVISSDDEIEELALDQTDNRTNKSSQDGDSLDKSDIKNDEESQFIDRLKENSINTTFKNNVNEADIFRSEVSNLHLQPDIQNRLPTPANLDEYTYDDILDFDEAKNALDNITNKSNHDYDSLNQSEIKNDGDESQLTGNLKKNPINTYNYRGLSNNINEVDVVCNEVSNLHLQPDIQNRLPTPANLDEYMYNDMLVLDQEKNVLDKRTNKSSHDHDSLDQSDIKNDVESQLMGNSKEYALNTYNYPTLYNNINKVDIVCNDNLHLPPDIKNRLPTPASLNEDDDDDSLDLEEEKILLRSTENLSLRSNLNHGTYASQYCHTPEKDRSLSEEHSQCFPDTSQEVHEETTNNVSGNHLEDSSLLNDTIEEMERLLNEGLKTMPLEKYNNENMENYVNPGESITPRTPTNAVTLTPTSNAPTINILPSSEIKGSILHCGSNYNSNSTKGAIKKSMKNFATKIPVIPAYAHNTKPFTKPALTPTNYNKHNINVGSAPASLRKRFKNIESPISVYIKNSGVTPLYKKITPSKPLASNKIKSEKITKTNKENSILFPEVVYKPAKRAIITKSNDFKLPTKIESLISQKSNVIKHEGRIGTDGTRKDCILVNKKLLDVNLTIDSNASLDSIEDISIRYAKKTYIK